MVTLHSVVFEADGEYSDPLLKTANHGPAQIVRGRGGSKDTVKPGWVFLRPAEEQPVHDESGGRDGSVASEASATATTVGSGAAPMGAGAEGG